MADEEQYSSIKDLNDVLLRVLFRLANNRTCCTVSIQTSIPLFPPLPSPHHDAVPTSAHKARAPHESYQAALAHLTPSPAPRYDWTPPESQQRHFQFGSWPRSTPCAYPPLPNPSQPASSGRLKDASNGQPKQASSHRSDFLNSPSFKARPQPKEVHKNKENLQLSLKLRPQEDKVAYRQSKPNNQSWNRHQEELKGSTLMKEGTQLKNSMLGKDASMPLKQTQVLPPQINRPNSPDDSRYNGYFRQDNYRTQGRAQPFAGDRGQGGYGWHRTAPQPQQGGSSARRSAEKDVLYRTQPYEKSVRNQSLRRGPSPMTYKRF